MIRGGCHQPLGLVPLPDPGVREESVSLNIRPPALERRTAAHLLFSNIQNGQTTIDNLAQRRKRTSTLQFHSAAPAPTSTFLSPFILIAEQ